MRPKRDTSYGIAKALLLLGRVSNLPTVFDPAYLTIRIGIGCLLADQLGLGKLKPNANEEPKKVFIQCLKLHLSFEKHPQIS